MYAIFITWFFWGPRGPQSSWDIIWGSVAQRSLKTTGIFLYLTLTSFIVQNDGNLGPCYVTVCIYCNMSVSRAQYLHFKQFVHASYSSNIFV